MDAHLAEEIGGELADGSGANDELTVHTHEALRVELALGFFEGHVQGVGLAVEGAQADYAVKRVSGTVSGTRSLTYSYFFTLYMSVSDILYFRFSRLNS